MMVFEFTGKLKITKLNMLLNNCTYFVFKLLYLNAIIIKTAINKKKSVKFLW